MHLCQDRYRCTAGEQACNYANVSRISSFRCCIDIKYFFIIVKSWHSLMVACNSSKLPAILNAKLDFNLHLSEKQIICTYRIQKQKIFIVVLLF